MHKALIRREQFPVTDNLVYLNHAAVGPLSSDAYNAMEQHAREQRDYGAYYWRDWVQEYVLVRLAASRLLGCSPEEISILKNTTEGISFVAEGLAWKQGDNVVVGETEFPSNYVPWKRLESRGVECRVVKNHEGGFSLEDVAQLVDGRTRVVALSSVSFHNGFAPDLIAIGELCASRGAHLCVDAIQSLGALAMDVRKANISFLAADGHKWLLGPEGAAVFFASEQARDELRVLESGWMNTDLKGSWIGAETELLRDGRRFEGGTLNTNGVYGLRAAIDLINDVSPMQIEAEVLRVANRLAEKLEELEFAVHSPRPLRSGIVSVTPPRFDLEKARKGAGLRKGIVVKDPVRLFHRYLERQKVICAPREGMLRFAPHFYNDELDLDRAMAAIRRIL